MKKVFIKSIIIVILLITVLFIVDVWKGVTQKISENQAPQKQASQQNYDNVAYKNWKLFRDQNVQFLTPPEWAFTRNDGNENAGYYSVVFYKEADFEKINNQKSDNILIAVLRSGADAFMLTKISGDYVNDDQQHMQDYILTLKNSINNIDNSTIDNITGKKSEGGINIYSFSLNVSSINNKNAIPIKRNGLVWIKNNSLFLIENLKKNDASLLDMFDKIAGTIS